MQLKLIFGAIALVLVAVYLGAPVWKLNDVALGVVALAGFAMAAVDLWESLQEKD